METITSLILLTTCKETFFPIPNQNLACSKGKRRAKKCSFLGLYRYLLNPKLEVVRCFGVEYNPDDLSQEVLKEVTSLSQ